MFTACIARPFGLLDELVNVHQLCGKPFCRENGRNFETIL